MKQRWKPGTLLYPLPAVMVSCGNAPENYNIITVSWTGTICSAPPDVLHIRKEGKTFLRHPKRNRRIRHQPQHGKTGLCHGLVRSMFRKERE